MSLQELKEQAFQLPECDRCSVVFGECDHLWCDYGESDRYNINKIQ